MLSFFPRGVLDEILNLIESVSGDFPSYSFIQKLPSNIIQVKNITNMFIYVYKIIGPTKMKNDQIYYLGEEKLKIKIRCALNSHFA